VRFGVWRLDLGQKTEPGAFSLTSITFRDAADQEAVSDRVEEIFREMTEMDGVISTVTTKDGERGHTMTAWETPEDARQLMRGGTHETAAQELFARDGLGAAAMTSVWTPERVNGRMLRCTECLEMTYEVEADTCPDCGATLPEAPPYW
jgi:rRNA maturation endonuclease Nob1